MSSKVHQDAAKLETTTPATLTSGELFDIHAEFRAAEAELSASCQNVEILLAAEQAESAYLTDFERRFEEHVSELRARSDLLAAALDRIKIVALNTGLEGARLGDLAGKVLVGVSDEIRHLTSRGLDLLLEQTTALEQLEKERQRLREVAARHHHPVEQCARLKESLKVAEGAQLRALSHFSNTLEASTGLDTEAQAHLVRASAQARELLLSLGQFAKPEHVRIVRETMAAELRPLLEFLAQQEADLP